MSEHMRTDPETGESTNEPADGMLAQLQRQKQLQLDAMSTLRIETCFIGTPEQMAETYAALAKAQGQFETVELNKTAKIPMKAGGSYSYPYADLGAVIKATRKALSDNGLAISQPVGPDGQGWLILTTRVLHASGGEIAGRMPVPPLDSPDLKLLGTSLTYLRRYSLNAIINVFGEGDSDSIKQEESEGVTFDPELDNLVYRAHFATSFGSKVFTEHFVKKIGAAGVEQLGQPRMVELNRKAKVADKVGVWEFTPETVL
jgi:hypothetical protein